jgi:predicted phage terminase large subunit-like protein
VPLTLSPTQINATEKMVAWWDDFELFCREAMGYADMNDEHSQLCSFIQNPSSLFQLILMPRYTFKSSIATVARSLWHLLRDENRRILIYSDSSAKAEAFLSEIKHHLLGQKATSQFRNVVGAWEVDPKKGVWNQSALVIAARTQARAEPSVDTAGIETSKVGMHYDDIIFDDIVSDKNITSRDLMDKVAECYRKALSLLRPSGTITLVGTRWHFSDLYGRLLAENTNTKMFSTFIRKAEVNGKYPFASVGLTPQFLRQQKQQQGSYIHSCLYQNEPANPEDAIFKIEHFSFYDPRAIPKGLYITCCLDPATGQGEDNAALTVVGTDEQLNMWLLEIVSGKLLPSEQVEVVFNLHYKWGIKTFGIEVNHYQKMLRRDLEFRVAEERRRNRTFRLFHVAEFTGTSVNTKDMRIRALQPYHERQAIKLPGSRVELLEGAYARLTSQMIQYTDSHKPAHDDELDSLAQHVSIHQQGQAEHPTEEFPYTSAKWFERHYWLPKEREARRWQPRWKQSPEPELAFS